MKRHERQQVTLSSDICSSYEERSRCMNTLYNLIFPHQIYENISMWDAATYRKYLVNQSIECMQLMQSTNIHVQHHDQNKTHPFWSHINTTGQYPPGDDHQNVPKKIDVKSEEHWELNRRRPSVIRRSMKGGNNCLTTREAILQPQLQYSTQKNSNISPSMLPSKYDSESSIIPNTNYYHSTLSPSSKSETPRIPNNHLQHSTLPLSAEPDITIKPEANAVKLSDSMHENLYIRQSKHRFEARGNSEIILCQKDNLLNKKLKILTRQKE